MAAKRSMSANLGQIMVRASNSDGSINQSVGDSESANHSAMPSYNASPAPTSPARDSTGSDYQYQGTRQITDVNSRQITIGKIIKCIIRIPKTIIIMKILNCPCKIQLHGCRRRLKNRRSTHCRVLRH
jgi:hypothetical protein